MFTLFYVVLYVFIGIFIMTFTRFIGLPGLGSVIAYNDENDLDFYKKKWVHGRCALSGREWMYGTIFWPLIALYFVFSAFITIPIGIIWGLLILNEILGKIEF